MFFKKKVPKCNDVEYVDTIFSSLSFFVAPVTTAAYIEVYNLLNQKKHFESLEVFAQSLGLKVVFADASEIDDYIYNMPVIYEWEVIGSESGLTSYEIRVTPFGKKMTDIAFVEIALLIVSFKLSTISMEVPNSIWDEPSQRRHFLTCCCLAFGLGIAFLERNWIIGKYVTEQTRESFDVKYYIPMHLTFLIYGSAKFSYEANELITDHVSRQVGNLTSEIKSEFTVCSKFLAGNGG